MATLQTRGEDASPKRASAARPGRRPRPSLAARTVATTQAAAAVDVAAGDARAAEQRTAWRGGSRRGGGCGGGCSLATATAVAAAAAVAAADEMVPGLSQPVRPPRGSLSGLPPPWLLGRAPDGGALMRRWACASDTVARDAPEHALRTPRPLSLPGAGRRNAAACEIARASLAGRGIAGGCQWWHAPSGATLRWAFPRPP